MKTLFDISPQCCDAGSYMQYGSECAKDITACYGDLRPIGDYLWFSIPERLGLAPENIVVVNCITALLGALFWAFVLKRILSVWGGVFVNKVVFSLLLFISLAAHAFFLRPTIFNSLSDPPATAMLLLGVGCLVLSSIHGGKPIVKAAQIFFAGIFLGSAAWLRAFYLYPALACVFVYLLLWVAGSNRQWKELLVLAALLPIGIQFSVMYRAYGTIGYLQQDMQSSWTQTHLNAPFTGFDTVMPRNGHFWSPQHCEASVGILNGLAQQDYKSVACVVIERLRFYFGTYEIENYIFSDAKNYLVRQNAENIGDINAEWFSQNLRWEKDVAAAPSGQKTADRLTVVAPAVGGTGDTVQWVELPAETAFTFSVWLWSPKPKTINLLFGSHSDSTIAARRQFTLAAFPVRYSITGETRKAGLYDVGIGRLSSLDDPISFGTEEGDALYVWGAQLEKGNVATAYDGAVKISPESIRVWRQPLLMLNVLALLLFFIAIYQQRALWVKSRTGIAIISLFTVVLAECVAIIPEQRFAIGLMVIIWTIALAGLAGFFWRKPIGLPQVVG
ncbi:MAG: hypothetical protein IPK30_04025 [Cellvibrionales bacterium]|nr:hypothetical protein [Cellvibrionales bacterium]